MKKNRVIAVSILTILLFVIKVNSQIITSPNGKIACSLEIDKTTGNLQYSVNYDGKPVIQPSSFQLNTSFGSLGKDFTVVKTDKVAEHRATWENKLGELKEIPDNYNELKLHLRSKGNTLNFICRVYNEGVAFAYELPIQGKKDSIEILNENLSFSFKEDYQCWATYTAQGVYNKVPLSEIKNGCERPLVVECNSKLTVALAEAALVDFARMKFGPDSTAPNSVKTVLHGKTVKKLPFQSPWRVVMIAESPGKLLEQNYLVQNLNAPSAIKDLSWVTPGKVIRDGTLTTKGAKACVDFVASHGMQYVEFDAGWYGPENDMASDATRVSLDPKRSKGPFELEEIIRYAKEKNIKVILYVNRRALEQQLDTLLPLYQKWGVAGIKYGFVQVGDHKYTNWLHDAVLKTAKHKMIVDIHDEYRPTGFSRTYPNLLTQEGIRGDEESIPNSHTLITMFTRMLAGAGDNTVCYYAERVTSKMGSHASQLAKPVCLFSPLQFLYWYDIPPQAPLKDDGLWGDTKTIGNEPELEFFNNIPTIWDETKVLTDKIGEFAIIARRNGSQWFIGGINAEKPVETTIKFDFLQPGKNYKVRIYSDDPLVNTRTHVRIDEIKVTSKTQYPVKVGANNGFAMHVVME